MAVCLLLWKNPPGAHNGGVQIFTEASAKNYFYMPHLLIFIHFKNNRCATLLELAPALSVALSFSVTWINSNIWD